MLALEISALKKSYPGGIVLDVGRFSLDAGEQTALEGGSGTGKTTFLHVVAGILQADSGTVRVDGREMTGLSEPARDRLRAETIGYVFQTFNLLQGLTALENVLVAMMFGGRPDATLAEALLRRVGLGERLHYRPAELSVGQQQRVAVARALANRPKLVLADEPTGSLDARRAGETIALIREICRERGAALLLVSHDPAVLEQFETVRSLAELNRAGRAGAPR